MKKKLLVILSDYISSWIHKGEVGVRYYNPGNYFDEVHFLFTNDDKVDPLLLRPMVGDAQIYVHNYPEPTGFFRKTLGWHPYLMRTWAKGALKLIQEISPNIVRCHGLFLNTFLAAELKKNTNIPVITSLHGNPDVDYLRGRLANNFKEKIIGKCQERLEKYCLKNMDHVIAVYSPIVPYLIKHKVKSYSVVHNVVAHNAVAKQNYDIDPTKVKLLCVGRQTISQKDPKNIIRAVAQTKSYHLTLVGDGDLHAGLNELAVQLDCADRIKFIRNLDNKSILELMRASDIYIYHSINYEISKGCIEAALIGLPIILNDRFGEPAEELVDAGFILVEDTPEAYSLALNNLVYDDELRKYTAKNSKAYALAHWAPEVTESKVVDIYKEYMIL